MKYYTKYADINCRSGCDFSTKKSNYYFSNSSYRTHKMNYYTNYYTKYAKILANSPFSLNCGHGNYDANSSHRTQNIKKREYMSGYFSAAYHVNHNFISDKPHHTVKRGTKNIETDKLADQLCGEKEELENWQYFVFNNDLPLFINICLNIDQHCNSKKYLPWLTDKKYTDEEIYDKLKFTEEEINLINKTLQKYERYSEFFRLCANGE